MKLFTWCTKFLVALNFSIQKFYLAPCTIPFCCLLICFVLIWFSGHTHSAPSFGFRDQIGCWRLDLSQPHIREALYPLYSLQPSLYHSYSFSHFRCQLFSLSLLLTLYEFFKSKWLFMYLLFKIDFLCIPLLILSYMTYMFLIFIETLKDTFLTIFILWGLILTRLDLD